MRKKLLGIGLLLATAAGVAGPLAAAEKDEKPAKPRKTKAEWKLAVQTYTFNRFTFYEAVDKAKALGLEYVEGYGWQKISKELGDLQLNYNTPETTLKAVKKYLDAADVDLVAYYVHEIGKDEAETRRNFEFAKFMGIKTFVGEPKAEWLPLLDKLTAEYKISVAIHNHPKKPGDDSYTHWKPENVAAMVKPYNPRIGMCADTGHWVRSGVDPIEGLKIYGDRLISLHLKDVHEQGEKGHDVPFGTGVSNLRGQLEQLAAMDFKGLVSIEYEHNMENNVEDVARCIQVVHTTAKELGAKVK